jgi:hypothetical protein
VTRESLKSETGSSVAPKKELSSVGLLFAVPRPSYSTAELCQLVRDKWPAKVALQRIRQAIKDGLLHPFRRGGRFVNEFTFESVVGFVMERYVSSEAELLNAMLLTGFRFVYMPAALLLRTAGGWKVDSTVWLWGRSRDDDPVTGTRENPEFPVPFHDSHVARVAPRMPDDRVPHLRTRIRMASEPKSRRLEKRQAEADARAARRVNKAAGAVELNSRVVHRVDDEPVDDMSREELARAFEPDEPAPRKRTR